MKNFYLDLREQAVKLIIMKKRNDTINKWIKKKLDNGKKKKYIAFDLCQAHFQVLLINYLKYSIVINA